jgi:hypothetical protein
MPTRIGRISRHRSERVQQERRIRSRPVHEYFEDSARNPGEGNDGTERNREAQVAGEQQDGSHDDERNDDRADWTEDFIYSVSKDHEKARVVSAKRLKDALVRGEQVRASRKKESVHGDKGHRNNASDDRERESSYRSK